MSEEWYTCKFCGSTYDLEGALYHMFGECGLSEYSDDLESYWRNLVKYAFETFLKRYRRGLDPRDIDSVHDVRCMILLYAVGKIKTPFPGFPDFDQDAALTLISATAPELFVFTVEYFGLIKIDGENVTLTGKGDDYLE